MRTHTIETYNFNELTADARSTAVSDNFHVNVEDNYWYEDIIEDAKLAGSILGINVEKIFFSGFSCQGDGAQFVGRYEYSLTASSNIRQYAPLDKKLHEIADELTKVQKSWANSLSATVSSQGRYCHEYCTNIVIECDEDKCRDEDEWLDERERPMNRDFIQAEKALKSCLRSFMRWTYGQLSEAYDFATSEDRIIEQLELNEFEFLANGATYTPALSDETK